VQPNEEHSYSQRPRHQADQAENDREEAHEGKDYSDMESRQKRDRIVTNFTHFRNLVGLPAQMRFGFSNISPGIAMNTFALASRTLLACTLVAGLTALGSADPTAYVATGSSDFESIDLATGNATEIGNMGQRLSGLGETSDGSIYGIAYTGSELYQVNTATGALIDAGNLGVNFILTGSTADGTIYGLGSDDNLYSVDVSNHTAHLLGATGLGIGGWSGMSDGSSGLFISTGSQVYTMNLGNGNATATSLGTGGDQFGAMVEEGSVLYGGVDNGNVQLDTIDESTGVGTFATNSSGMNSNYWGLAEVPSGTPEPFTIGLGVAGIALAVRRRARSR
jgi:hypothetical protein